MTAICLLLAATLPLAAQDGLAVQGFGFGFDDDTGGADNTFEGLAASPIAVTISGEIGAAFQGYFDDFSNGADAVDLGDVFSGKLNFAASGSNADGVINLKLKPVFDDSVSPVTIDEAYLRAYFGDFNVEAGLRKLTWGKADSMGPLDVINPMDISDMTGLNDPGNLKLAVPLLHTTYTLGSFTKLEAVFVPGYKPVPFPQGRWAPAAMAQLSAMTVTPSNTGTLDYSQAGFRFTTTLGSSDIGFQYYYGRLSDPVMTFSGGPPPDTVNIGYNPYHQIGADWAKVIAGFNIRAELAANLTDDFEGDEPEVYNPAIAWSLGFDRELFWGITLNLQANESIILLHNKIADDPIKQDPEAESDITATLLIGSLSKNFLHDELQVSVAGLYEIEARDFVIMPGISWTKEDIKLDCQFGVFGGDEDGQFGQYHKNNFVRVGLTYTF
jgi:hypothetical protein